MTKADFVQWAACVAMLIVVYPLHFGAWLIAFFAMFLYAEALKAKCGIGLYDSAPEKCILKMLDESPEPMYGLDMVKQSAGRLGKGTIYVWLGRLQERGEVFATEPDADGRRRYYTLGDKRT